MGGISPISPTNVNPGVTPNSPVNPLSNQMFINPNQRTFQTYNPNIPANMYSNATTGNSNYSNSLSDKPSLLFDVPNVSNTSGSFGNVAPNVNYDTSNYGYLNSDVFTDAPYPSSGGNVSSDGYVNNDGFIDAPYPSSSGIISGGGSDGVGNLGVVGDIAGGIGDALNITNYDGSQSDKPSGNKGGK